MSKPKARYRYVVTEAHGSPPANLKKGSVIEEPEDYGNTDVLFDVKAGRVVWLVFIAFDGLVQKAERDA